MKYLEEQQTIKQYLLGQLSTAESEVLEKKVLTDPEYMDAVSLIENELIEDFVANELPDRDKEHFLKHFLSTPHQRQKLELVEAVHTYFAGGVPSSSAPVTEKAASAPWQRWTAVFSRKWQYSFGFRVALGILGTVLVGVIIFLVWSYVSNRSGIKYSVALQEKLIRFNDARHRDELLKNASTSRVLLTSDFVRSEAGMPKVSVPGGTEVVRFEIPAPQSQSYMATLRAIDGEQIFTLPSVNTEVVNGNRELIVNVPAEFLSEADYELNFNGLDGKSSDVRSYFFRVTR